MIVIPAGYIGYKYWERRRLRRLQEARSINSNEAPQEPPSFREFVKSIMYRQDKEGLITSPEGSAHAVIQELNQIFGSACSSSDEISMSFSSGSLTCTSTVDTSDEETSDDVKGFSEVEESEKGSDNNNGEGNQDVDGNQLQDESTKRSQNSHSSFLSITRSASTRHKCKRCSS